MKKILLNFLRDIQSIIYDFSLLIKSIGRNKKLHIRASKQVSTERIKICRDCQMINNTKLGPRCNVCGCFLKLKTKLDFEECPKEKW